MSDLPVTLFHNPACGTSRNVLAMVREAGHEPTVVEYLKAGWTEPQLRDLLTRTFGRISGAKGIPGTEKGFFGPRRRSAAARPTASSRSTTWRRVPVRPVSTDS